MQFPDTLRYTKEHEWVRIEGTRARVGITDFAQDSLGDVVFIQLPEVGLSVEQGTSVCEVESTKSVSDIYAPLPGVLVAVNESLKSAPELVNHDPYGEGWILEIDASEPVDVESLLDSEAYRGLVEG